MTWRAVLIAILLIPLNSYWIMQMEAIYYSAHSTLIALFFNVVFNLLILIVLNIPLRKISPKLVLRQGELVTLYIMLSQSAALVGHSMIQILPPTMAAPVWLGHPGERMERTLRPLHSQMACHHRPVDSGWVHHRGKNGIVPLYRTTHRSVASAGTHMVCLYMCIDVCDDLCQYNHSQAVVGSRAIVIPDCSTPLPDDEPCIQTVHE